MPFPIQRLALIYARLPSFPDLYAAYAKWLNPLSAASGEYIGGWNEALDPLDRSMVPLFASSQAQSLMLLLPIEHGGLVFSGPPGPYHSLYNPSGTTPRALMLSPTLCPTHKARGLEAAPERHPPKTRGNVEIRTS